jgi:transposase
VLPAVCTAAMNAFLRRFAATLLEDEHAVMVLDGAGWHSGRDLAVPDNVTLLSAPPYSPELNPVERVWLYLRERHLSHRVHEAYAEIIDALCNAWLKLTPERLRSLCSYPWIKQVIG